MSVSVCHCSLVPGQALTFPCFCSRVFVFPRVLTETSLPVLYCGIPTNTNANANTNVNADPAREASLPLLRR